MSDKLFIPRIDEVTTDSVIFFGGMDHKTMWSVPIETMGLWFHSAVEEGYIRLDESNENLYLGNYVMRPGDELVCNSQIIIPNAIVRHTIAVYRLGNNAEFISVSFETEV